MIHTNFEKIREKAIRNVNHDGAITHLESDILECEVKWPLGSITTNKASGVNGISAELFQILKDDAVKSAVLNIPANLENSAVATGLEKGQLSFQSKKGSVWFSSVLSLSRVQLFVTP